MLIRLVILSILILSISAGCLQEKFSGIAPQPYPAPDFALTNQDGKRVSLQDYRGKIVVMSFMYINCPTVCPLITSKFLECAKLLEAKTGKDVIFIGISVDPEGDTPESVKRFLESKGMTGKMEFLTGSRKELETVWENYNVYVNKTKSEDSEGYMIDHTAVVYVLDKKGYLRVLYPGLNWYPKYLAGDINTLLKEDNPLYRVIYSIPKPEV